MCIRDSYYCSRQCGVFIQEFYYDPLFFLETLSSIRICFYVRRINIWRQNITTLSRDVCFFRCCVWEVAKWFLKGSIPSVLLVHSQHLKNDAVKYARVSNKVRLATGKERVDVVGNFLFTADKIRISTVCRSIKIQFSRMPLSSRPIPIPMARNFSYKESRMYLVEIFDKTSFLWATLLIQGVLTKFQNVILGFF